MERIKDFLDEQLGQIILSNSLQKGRGLQGSCETSSSAGKTGVSGRRVPWKTGISPESDEG